MHKLLYRRPVDCPQCMSPSPSLLYLVVVHYIQLDHRYHLSTGRHFCYQVAQYMSFCVWIILRKYLCIFCRPKREHREPFDSWNSHTKYPYETFTFESSLTGAWSRSGLSLFLNVLNLPQPLTRQVVAGDAQFLGRETVLTYEFNVAGFESLSSFKPWILKVIKQHEKSETFWWYYKGLSVNHLLRASNWNCFWIEQYHNQRRYHSSSYKVDERLFSLS